MDLRLSEDQKMIREAARDFLEGECPSSFVRDLEGSSTGHDPHLWQAMAELGLMGVSFPEEYGGLGKGFLELCVLIEEMGRFRLTGPFFTTVALCGMAIIRFGTQEQKSQYLGPIAGGERIMAYAALEPGRSWDTSSCALRAEEDDGAWILNGVKIFVPYAEAADDLLVLARTGEGSENGLTLFIVDTSDPGVSLKRLQTLGPEHQYEVLFEDVSVQGNRILGAPGRGLEASNMVSQWGAAAKCAQMVGGAQRVLEMSVEYAKERVQFGKPIGTFQAVQHNCANMAVDLDSSRFISYEAIWRLEEGLEAATEVSAAKAWVSDACSRVCRLGHGVHGAIGFTMEHDMQLYSRHCKEAELAFGDADWHREQVARRIGL